MTEDKSWEAEFEERKVGVRQQLIREGKVDWEHLKELGGLRNKRDFGAAIGILIDMNILTMKKKGFFAMGCGIFCNPRAPVLWGVELYFTTRKDCEDYVAVEYENAQYEVSIAEMT